MTRHALALLLAAAVPAAALAVPEGPAGAPAPDPRARPENGSPSRYGLMFDGGVPGGFGVSALVRPLDFLRIGLGGTYMGGAGVRASVDLVPFQWKVSPALSLEAGRVFDYDATWIGNNVLHLQPQYASAMRDIGYDYVTAQVGLEFGLAGRFVGFVRAGYGYITSSTSGFVQAVQASDPSHVWSGSDARVHVTMPVAKLGLMVFF